MVAFSSGNHAQGVAAAARILDMQATIVMPADAPLSKRERTKAYGAEVVLYDRDREDREAIARDIADKRGATLVPPYDDPMVIAGQGTVGREIAEDMAALGITPDIVVAPVSGGGLIAGVATAIKARYPQAELMSAEPEGFDDHARSLRAGKREPHRAEGRTICDALMASIPGEITFAINSRLLARGVTVSDAEVGAAVGFAFRELKLVVEPGGAVGLAALLAGRIDARGRNVVIVLSGGNVDADLFAKLIALIRKTARSSRPGSCAGSAPADRTPATRVCARSRSRPGSSRAKVAAAARVRRTAESSQPVLRSIPAIVSGSAGRTRRPLRRHRCWHPHRPDPAQPFQGDQVQHGFVMGVGGFGGRFSRFDHATAASTDTAETVIDGRGITRCGCRRLSLGDGRRFVRDGGGRGRLAVLDSRRGRSRGR